MLASNLPDLGDAVGRTSSTACSASDVYASYPSAAESTVKLIGHLRDDMGLGLHPAKARAPAQAAACGKTPSPSDHTACRAVVAAKHMQSGSLCSSRQ